MKAADAMREWQADGILRAALEHALKHYTGPADDTVPVLRGWLAACSRTTDGKTIENDILPRVQVQESGCWLWQLAASRSGYPAVTRQGVRMGAHRWAWILANGSIPDGMTIDHLCFTPMCVNPAHMQLLSHWENNQRKNKRRQRTHCKNGHEFTADNTEVQVGYNDQEWRYCVTCKTENEARRSERNRSRRRKGVWPAEEQVSA